MKRLMVVAKDRAFTRFVAESLLERSLDAFMPRPDDPWSIARAHSALEAEVLVTRGRRRFHAIVIDQSLPDRSALELARSLRDLELAASTPIFVVTERGRDPHARRTATEALGVAGFLERPVSARSLRAALDLLDRRRRLLLAEPEPELGQRLASACEGREFEVITASTREGTLRALQSFDPDVAAIAIGIDGYGGLGVCADIKRAPSDRLIPVVLYGQLAALPRQPTSENALRADDFVQAPFDDDTLIDRIVGQVGLGAASRPPPAPDGEADPAAESRDLPTAPGRIPRSGESKMTAPPPSASPASIGPTHRQTRRVPCRTSLRVRDGGSWFQSQTLDISHGGLHFQLDRTLEIGTLVDLQFQLPDSERTMTAVGRVAWTRPDGVGIKFSRIEKADLHEIVEYVNRVSRLLYSPS